MSFLMSNMMTSDCHDSTLKGAIKVPWFPVRRCLALLSLKFRCKIERFRHTATVCCKLLQHLKAVRVESKHRHPRRAHTVTKEQPEPCKFDGIQLMRQQPVQGKMQLFRDWRHPHRRKPPEDPT